MKVHEIELAITNGSPDLQRASRALVDQSIRAVEIEPLSLNALPTTLRFPMDYLWKFLTAYTFWLALGISRVPKILRGDKSSRTIALGLLHFGVFAELFGILIPPIWWPWFHLIVYPLSIVAAFYVFIFIPFMFWWCYPVSKQKTDQDTREKG